MRDFSKIHITKTYVRHILRNPYRYSLNTSHGMVNHSRLQPEVKTAGQNRFVIVTPYRDLSNQRIKFMLYIYKGNWRLSLNIDSHFAHAMDVIPHFKSYITSLLIKYQIGEISSSVYFIPLIDYSLQNAYYRLSHFALSYCSVTHFIIHMILK